MEDRGQVHKQYSKQLNEEETSSKSKRGVQAMGNELHPLKYDFVLDT